MGDGLAGSAELSLVSKVIPLDPETMVFRAMLDGWADQQRARLCKPPTIQARATTVRRFAEFTGTYPWQWRADDADAYFASLLSGDEPRADSTMRGYQNALQLFCAFTSDPRYGWTSLCIQRFNDAPSQILHEWNTATHNAEFEGRPGRRPLSYDEVQELFVRFGKSSRGSAPRRRTVLTVPEMDWIVEVLQDYLEEVRPRFAPGRHPALWVTERCGRLSKRSANAAFVNARDAAGLANELDLHSLRHSYVTHLTEFDYPERFVQDQVGHSYASSTAIYSHISDEYRNRLVCKALAKRGIAVGED